MISFVRALAAGQAVQVVLAPRAGADRWRLLRRLDADFADFDDPEALVVYEGRERLVLDLEALTNGVTYHYRAYDFMGGDPDNADDWLPSNAVSCVPGTTFRSISGDPLLSLRDRLEVGLREMVARGVLVHQKNRIQVVLGPPALDTIVLPVVTLHLTNERPGERAIGDEIAPDTKPDGIDRFDEHAGWLGHYEIAVVGWSTNADERHALRRALRDIVIANLPVFDGLGFLQVDFGQQDVEDFTSFNSPMYQTLGQFTCLAPVIVDASVGVVHQTEQEIIQP